MSNRNFDFSAIVKILNAQNNANFYNRQQTVVQATMGAYTIDLQSANPQTGNYDADTIATLQAGQQAYYFKGVPDTTVLVPQQYTPVTTGAAVVVPSLEAPVLTAIVEGNTNLSVSFTQAVGALPITNYKYSTNGGTTFTAFSPAITTSPVLITGLNNGPSTPYSVVLQAVSNATISASSNVLTGSPTASVPTTPVLNYALSNDNSAYIYFTCTLQSGESLQYSLDGGATYTNVTGSTSPALITGLTNGELTTIQFVNVNAILSTSSTPSNVLSVTPVAASVASPWLAFDPSNNASYPGTGTTLTNVGSYGALTGTLLNGVSYITGTGISRNVFNLNGSSQYISFGTFNFGSAITVTAWIYPTAKVSINTLLANGPPNVGSLGFKMAWNTWSTSDRAMLLETGDTSSNWYVPGTAAGAITLNVWQHVTYVLDVPNRAALFFVNGVPVTNGYGLTAANVVMNGRAFNIGAYSGGTYTPKAELGYLNVFNSVLDATQILADYDNSRASFGL